MHSATIKILILKSTSSQHSKQFVVFRILNFPVTSFFFTQRFIDNSSLIYCDLSDIELITKSVSISSASKQPSDKADSVTKKSMSRTPVMDQETRSFTYTLIVILPSFFYQHYYIKESPSFEKTQKAGPYKAMGSTLWMPPVIPPHSHR